MNNVERLFEVIIVTSAIFLGFLALLSHGTNIQCSPPTTVVKSNLTGNSVE